MGWIVSLVLLAIVAFSPDKASIDTILISGGLFAIAGSLASVANKLREQ